MNRHLAPKPLSVFRRDRARPSTVALMIATALLGAGGTTVVAAAATTKNHDKAVGRPSTSAPVHHAVVHGTARPPSLRTASAGVCGALAGHPKHIKHVIWIIMENRSYSEVIGAPYIASLAANCGVATNYHNITHPSLPNYIAMTSGRPMAQLPKNDCGGVLCAVPGPSIFTQTTSWGVFAESMPGNCVRHDVRPYVAHHTAAPFYTAVTNCASKDVPLTALNLAALPAFSLISPNVNNDMHQGSSSVAAGDAWLRTHLGTILASAAYRSGSTMVFLTWDEGGPPDHSLNCATNAIDNGCHVALLAMSPYIPRGARWTALANHYSLLGVTEELLGLPQLGQSRLAPDLSPALGS
jgi:hypothetical protein